MKMKNTPLEISGIKCHKLVDQLDEYWTLSTEAKTHLNAAATKGKVNLRSSGEECGNNIENGLVTISLDACKENGTLSINYLGESALFELMNSRNSNLYRDAKEQLTNKNITILEYGLTFATVESKATVVTAKILNQLQTTSYVISEWGKKQQSNYNSHSADFVKHFIDMPHSTKADVEWKYKLKTKHKYAFEKIEKMVTVTPAQKIVLSIAKELNDATDIVKGKLWGLFETWNQSIPQLICSYIYALQALESNGRKVTWESTTAGGTWVDLADDLLNHAGTLSRNQKVYELRLLLDKVFTERKY